VGRTTDTEPDNLRGYAHPEGLVLRRTESALGAGGHPSCHAM